MSDNNHVTIMLNDSEISKNLENGKNRGRVRGRSGSRSRSPSRSRTRRDTESARRDATPLLPEAALPRQKPPNAGPEIDDDENGDGASDITPIQGIDDGFFDEKNVPDSRRDKYPRPEFPRTDERRGSTPRRGSVPAVFPYSPPDYGGPGVIQIPGSEPRVIPDINVYQHKKTLAQGMMDLALISANANQLRYVLESYERHPYYYFSLTFIIASLVFQVLVGVGLVFNSRYNVKNQDDICKADKINNLITVAILLITIINVFISAFGVAEIKSN